MQDTAVFEVFKQGSAVSEQNGRHFHKKKLHILRANNNWWRPVAAIVTSHCNTSTRLLDLAQLSQLWFNPASPLSAKVSVTNNFCRQRTAPDSEYISNNNTEYKSVTNSSHKYKSTTRTSVLRGLLLRCMTTAACSSQTSGPDDLSLTSGSIQDVDGDGLPGVRIRRKISLEQRVNVHTSEQEISQWMEKETGIDRVRMMYSVGPDGRFIHEDTSVVNTMFYRSVFLGAGVSLFSAMFAQHSQKPQKHISKTQALLHGVSNERVALKSIFSQTLKDTLKVTSVCALLFHGSQAIAAYRNKSSVWEYAITSTVGFGILGLGHGVKQCAKLLLRGAVIGTLGGYVVCSVLASYGLNREQRHLDIVRHLLQEQKMMKQKIQNS